MRSPIFGSALLLVSALAFAIAQGQHKGRVALAQEHRPNRPVLVWGRVDGAESYHLEISRSQTFSKILFQVDQKETSFTWVEARPGRYFWRVFPVDPSGVFGDPKPITKLVVIAPAPLPTTASMPQQAGLEESRKAGTRLEWKKPRFAKSFELQVASGPGFENARSRKLLKNQTLVRFNRPGHYYWRVRSLDRKGRPISRYSQAAVVEVVDGRAPANARPHKKNARNATKRSAKSAARK